MPLWQSKSDGADRAGRDVAVIDIGSNSVRMVVYSLVGRVFLPKLNEKVLAGLGRGLQQRGKLDADGSARALKALMRFRALLDALGVSEVDVTATAAVRDATDGPDFAARVEREAGFRLRVLDGEGEAYTSALGVCAGIRNADGVVADLGGSSLELVRVPLADPAGGETFPLGPLALETGERFDHAQLLDRVRSRLATSRVLPKGNGVLYAVGGAWRAFARLHMEEAQYPLMVLQQYAIPAPEAADLARRVGEGGRKLRPRIDSVAGKRAESLPYAAAVLEALVDLGQLSSVVISSYGLREGVLFKRLSATQQAADPLVEAMVTAFGADPRQVAFGKAMEAWVRPVFDAVPGPMPAGDEDRLVAAACRLADLGATLHPDHRPDIAFELIVRGPYAGASHAERVFIALAVASRYAREFTGGTLAQKLLPTEWRTRALALGAVMRLGSDFSGRSAELLSRARLSIESRSLVLRLAKSDWPLVSETVERRHQMAADALGLQALTAMA
jgi:exopolyphosphatase/guanosine-5'-triphosphate,3'-diphosphate pyrophosphatase